MIVAYHPSRPATVLENAAKRLPVGNHGRHSAHQFAVVHPHKNQESRMRRSLAIACACGALLFGCAAYDKSTKEGDPKNPQVTVRNGQIEVPLGLYFARDEKDVRVTWRLPADSKLRFPENGIVIEGALTEKVQRVTMDSKTQIGVVLETTQDEIVDCRVEKQGLAFSCFNRHSRPGIYKYTIRVRDGDKTLERDPFIMNN